MRNLYWIALPVMLLPLVALPGKGALAGTSVTGSLTFSGDPSNYFDPGYGFVPSTGYLNTSSTTVAISNSAVEFGYDDGGNRLSADFTDAQLSVNDLVESAGSNLGWQMTFSDPAFAGESLFLVSDSLPLSGYSVTGDLITLNYAGGSVTAGQNLTATFAITSTPEPSTAGALVLSGFAALVFCFVRKWKNSAG